MGSRPSCIGISGIYTYAILINTQSHTLHISKVHAFSLVYLSCNMRSCPTQMCLCLVPRVTYGLGRSPMGWAHTLNIAHAGRARLLRNAGNRDNNFNALPPDTSLISWVDGVDLFTSSCKRWGCYSTPAPVPMPMLTYIPVHYPPIIVPNPVLPGSG